MKTPIIDLKGRVIFPQDTPIHQEGEHVGDNGNTTDHHDIGATVTEAEQTADLAENDRHQAEKLWNRGWRRGHRDGYQDGYQDAVDNMAKREKSDGDD